MADIEFERSELNWLYHLRMEYEAFRDLEDERETVDEHRMINKLTNAGEGERFALEIDSPRLGKWTRVVETVSGEQAASGTDLEGKDVDIWICDLSRMAGNTDEMYAVLRSHRSEERPVVQLYGYTPTPETEAEIEYLGDITRLGEKRKPGSDI